MSKTIRADAMLRAPGLWTSRIATLRLLLSRDRELTGWAEIVITRIGVEPRLVSGDRNAIPPRARDREPEPQSCLDAPGIASNAPLICSEGSKDRDHAKDDPTLMVRSQPCGLSGRMPRSSSSG